MAIHILLAIISLLFSCTENSVKNSEKNTSSNTIYQDSTYTRTGFYFLEDEIDGIKMKKENSSDVYFLHKNSFASIDNVQKTEIKKTKIENETYTELCFTFDDKGKKDLEEGTGNAEHPQIAVVIANKLLYVVNNSVKIKTGVMCVGLVGYTEEEMAAIKKAVDQKK